MDRDRGRSAQRPQEIPRSGWRDILLRVWQRLGTDNASLVSAGIALNAVLAVFPALTLAASLYGMFRTPAQVAADMRPFFDVLPHDAAGLLSQQLQAIAHPAGHELGIGAVLSALLTLFSARYGVAALISACNIAYHERERRGFFHLLAITMLFTAGALLSFIFMLALGVLLPLLLERLPFGAAARTLVLALRWVLLWLSVVLAGAVVYRYAPSRARPRWHWVTWGSAIAATVWLAASLLFALYAQHFGSYGKTYGALGGVIILLTWFYITGFALVLGAAINAEMEHQTARDTTTGQPEPMGRRGAYVADTLGPVPGHDGQGITPDDDIRPLTARRSESPRPASPSSDH